jgi:hypothetical protein
VKTVSAVGVILLTLAQLATAQIHGLGFVQGKVVDDKGHALADVTLSAALPRVGGRLVGTSDEKGAWKVIGMAHGEWDITFEKPGYTSGRARVVLEPELARIPPLEIRLKPQPKTPAP